MLAPCVLRWTSAAGLAQPDRSRWAFSAGRAARGRRISAASMVPCCGAAASASASPEVISPPDHLGVGRRPPSGGARRTSGRHFGLDRMRSGPGRHDAGVRGVRLRRGRQRSRWRRGGTRAGSGRGTGSHRRARACGSAERAGPAVVARAVPAWPQPVPDGVGAGAAGVTLGGSSMYGAFPIQLTPI